LWSDFDLAILGTDEATYVEYAANIRKEYSWVPEDKWIAGRPNVLKSLMSGDVYFTEAFKAFEAAAKRNMTQEIARINAGGN
jgi:predicted metal-dependent HD superfamily phosphohydrolase